jgi:hypothetical protein
MTAIKYATVVALTAIASLMSVTSCRAQPNTAYGIEIGAPLPLTECPRKEIAGSVMYGVAAQPCVQDTFPKVGVPLDRGGGLIVFPPGQSPAGSAWNRIGVVLLDGRVGALVVSTAGLHTQQQVYDTLVAKYGEPSQKSLLPVQNALGAKFESIVATWDRGENLQVLFRGTSGRIDSGEILIGTHAGLAERQARIDRAVKGTSRPL